MNVNLGPLGTNSTFQILLPRGCAVVLQTDGLGTLSTGYALVEATTGIGGTAVFSVAQNNVSLFHTGVASRLFSTSSACLSPRTGDSDTGVAIINGDRNWGDTKGTLRLYDSDFILVATKEVTLAPSFGTATKNQLAAYSYEIFPEMDTLGIQEGVVQVEGDQPLAAITLRQHRSPSKPFPEDVYLLTAFPVVAGCAR